METKNTLENYSNELNKQLLSLDSNFSNLLKTLVIGSDSTLADTENDVSHKFEDGICINCEFSEKAIEQSPQGVISSCESSRGLVAVGRQSYADLHVCVVKQKFRSTVCSQNLVHSCEALLNLSAELKLASLRYTTPESTENFARLLSLFEERRRNNIELREHMSLDLEVALRELEEFHVSSSAFLAKLPSIKLPEDNE